MAREVEPGFHWIQECGTDLNVEIERGVDPPDWYEPGCETHIGQSAYVLDDERSLLFDTLSPASTDRILAELDELLDDGLDYLVVSHPDVPHAGNAPAILDAYPEATLVAPRYGADHELYHLEDATNVGAGDSIDLGRFTVDFHEATFPDAAMHVWMTERTTETLFPVDWFGFPHNDTECGLFVDEFERPLSVDRLTQFHGRVLFWLQYVDVAKTSAEIERVIERFAPEIVAPAHGCVVRAGAAEHMRRVTQVVEQVSEHGRVGILG
jgi:flavorubredoxin